MKKIILVVSIVILSNIAVAQELALPANNQYLADNEFLIAPTFSGIGNNVRVRATAVSQWVGMKNAPDFQSISGDMRMGDKSGLGMTIYNDRNGFTRQMGGKFTFSHHLVLDRYDNNFLSFGISYLVNSFHINADKFRDYGGAPITDVGVQGNRNTVNHNFEVGALYRYKGFYASLTASNILNKDTDIFAINEPNKLRNYQLYTGYIYKKTRTAVWELEPSTFIQYFESDGRSTADINLKFRWYDFEDYYWVGATYRMINEQSFAPLSAGPMFGMKRGMFYFGYGYQVMLNELIGHNTGTHMITIGLDFFQGIGGCNCTEKW